MGILGVENSISSIICSNLSAAPFINIEWAGTLIGRGIALLAPNNLHSSMAFSIPCLFPDRTI